ncbi:ABC transporter substrate-binding protein [Rhodococcus sp. C26F]
MRKTRFAAVAVSLTFAAAACGGGSGSADDGVIRIAAIYPMTGSAAGWGTTSIAALEQVIEDTNASGGVPVAGETYTIELDVFDDEQNPEVAQARAREILDDGYDFIWGPMGSGSASAVQSLMAQSDSVWHLMAAAVEGPTKSPNVFRTAARVNTYTQATLDWLAQHPEIQTVAMITDQVHTGLVSEQANLVKGIEALGREVVLQLQHKLGDTDFRAPLTQMASSSPDLFMIRAYPSETALITKQARELGFAGNISWNGGLTNDEVGTLIGDENLMVNVTQAGPLTSLDSFVASGDTAAVEFAEQLGSEAGAFTANHYDGAHIFLAALEKAEEVSPEGLIKAMQEITVADIADQTLQTFEPQEGDRLFDNREVVVKGAVTDWIPGTGWVVEQQSTVG